MTLPPPPPIPYAGTGMELLTYRPEDAEPPAPTMTLTYRVLKGDVLDHIPVRPTWLLHVVNTVGAWGAGFTGPLAKRHPYARTSYLEWAGGRRADLFGLGKWLSAPLGEWLTCAHLCAQDGLPSRQNPTPFNQSAFAKCLTRFRDQVLRDGGAGVDLITIPMGCGYGGADWRQDVESLLLQHLGHTDASLTVYDPQNLTGRVG